MTNEPRRGRTTALLIVIEWTTIVAGLVMATVVLVKDCITHPTHTDVLAAAFLAPSACTHESGPLGVLHAWLDGAELAADPVGPEPTIDDAMRARGQQLFTKYCATCHGERGDGTGPTASQLQHPPANFTIGIYELRTTEHEALPADGDMFRTITRGVHGTAMPPWFELPEIDRWALAAHLKTLSKQFQEDEAPPPVDVRSPTVTPERLVHGRQLYGTAGCASCHGPTGRGDGVAATSLSYKSGARAKPRDLRLGRFHRSTRLADIYLTLVTGLDGTPMASFAKVLPPEDLWDVAMYVHSLTPPVTELPSGMRCPQIPAELRCFEIADKTKCSDPAANADEIVGIRTLMQSLHPTN